MEYIRLGKTDLLVSSTSFGALPIQRTEKNEAMRILHKAYDAGINFYDTARFYSDSESKLGEAFSDRREKVIIATKSMAATKDIFLAELEQSLQNLKTDYVDIMQLHNPGKLPDLDDENSSLAGMEEAFRKGMIRFKGITNHSRDIAYKAIYMDYFDTIQFPLSMISDDADWKLAQKANETDHGVIAMKAMSGGLISNAKAAFAFMRRYAYVVPIWGIQFMSELEEFLGYEENNPVLDAKLKEVIANDREELAEDFCRALWILYAMSCRNINSLGCQDGVIASAYAL